MGFPTEIYMEDGISIHKAEGVLECLELKAELERLHSQHGFISNMDSIWDFRDATLDRFTSNDVSEIAGIVGNRWGIDGGSRVALVVRREVDFGIARMFQIHFEDVSSSQVGVFKNMNRAKKWLRREIQDEEEMRIGH